jgi:phosphoserine phosphatase RsbU/P
MSTSKPFPQRWSSLPQPALVAVAVIFCTLTSVYAGVWIYGALHTGIYRVELGFNHDRDTFYDPATSSIPVYNVIPGSPAERAGLRAGDQIVGLNGQPLRSYAPFAKIWSRSKPRDPVDVTVRRPGERELLTLHATFRSVPEFEGAEGVARSSILRVLNFFPIFFILVGFTVLFLRLDNPHAWLLALLFACFVAVPGFDDASLPRAMGTFGLVYRSFFLALIPAVFYIFFALFPEKSPLEKRVPWLKWVALAICMVQILPGLPEGNVRLPLFVARRIGSAGSEHLRLAMSYTVLFLGVVSLLWNCVSAETSAESRRKSRILLAGTLAGVVPWVGEHVIIDFFGIHTLFWVDTPLALLVLLYPLSFAYAVVKHRVLEIPALLRHSARYVLVQRSYFLLLFCAAMLAIFVFTHFFSGLFAEHSQFGMGLSAAFGVALVWVSGPIVKRGTDRIDRAFFRSSFDARMILQDLAQKTRLVTERNELARLLTLHIEGALHPKSLACYLESSGGNLVVEGEGGSGKQDHASVLPPRPKFPFRFGARFVLRDASAIPETLPLIEELVRNGKAWDVPPPVDDQPAENPALTPECLVPIVGPNNKLLGLLVLGPRRSEEPYSSEDKHLLESVAGQAAIALENMRLAQEMANRLELDRRAEREMQIARDVQSRLFPQVIPRLTTLEYAGSCIQARQVGGDYYDFWDFGTTHLALVLADISGKGISGALLMANLQANLRSRSAVAREDMLNTSREGQWLPGLLKSVNQLFYENTPDDRYATMFFAVYDDRSRQLEYANCGHNPPLLVRSTGEVQQLNSTASVIGISTQWSCTTQTVALQPNDILVIYTDGVTEANDADGNEFGEARLAKVVRENCCATPAELIAIIQRAVQQFSVGEQFDDLTLVVARAR